ncbi:hypothetical protein EBR16_08120, partial [bacterium]|nr:hypothetical protein [bacterium]
RRIGMMLGERMRLPSFGDAAGQPKRAVLELLRPLLAEAGLARRVAERGQAHAFAEHHPDAATERLRALLSRPAVTPTPHPWPLPKWRRLLGSLSRGYAWRRPLAREG